MIQCIFLINYFFCQHSRLLFVWVRWFSVVESPPTVIQQQQSVGNIHPLCSSQNIPSRQGFKKRENTYFYYIYSYSCKFNSKKQIAAIMVAAGCSLIPWIALSALLGSVVCEDPNQPLGSPVQLGESEPGVKKILEFTEERYNLGSNAMHRRKISRFISVTRQVTLTARLRHNFFIYLFNIDYITCTVCHCKQSLLCSVNVRVGVQNKGTHCLSIHSLFFRHKERRYIVF